METILTVVQITLSVLLIISILLQKPGEGMGGALGGGGGENSVKQARRGFDKFIFEATIVIAILFALTALIPIII